MFQTDHLHWQAKVYPDKSNAWGKTVVGVGDVEQSMQIIALTPKLSVPDEPEKFCDALNFLDRPPAIAIPEISRELWDAFTRWNRASLWIEFWLLKSVFIILKPSPTIT